MNLFRKHPIPQERVHFLAYYQAACAITAFQDSESERYNRVVAQSRSDPTTSDSLSPLLQAAARMRIANEDALSRYETLFDTLPTLPRDHFTTWLGLLTIATEWSALTYRNLSDISQGNEPDTAKAQTLLETMGEIQRIAENESRKLVKYLRVTADEHQLILRSAQEETDGDTWSPEVGTLKEAMRTATTAIDGLAMYSAVLGLWQEKWTDADLSRIDEIVREIWLPDWRELLSRLAKVAAVSHYPCITNLPMKLSPLYFRLLAFDMQLMRIASDTTLDGRGKAKALENRAAELKNELTDFIEWAKEASRLIEFDASSFLAAASKRSWTQWKPRMQAFFGRDQLERMIDSVSNNP